MVTEINPKIDNWIVRINAEETFRLIGFLRGSDLVSIKSFSFVDLQIESKQAHQLRRPQTIR